MLLLAESNTAVLSEGGMVSLATFAMGLAEQKAMVERTGDSWFAGLWEELSFQLAILQGGRELGQFISADDLKREKLLLPLWKSKAAIPSTYRAPFLGHGRQIDAKVAFS